MELDNEYRGENFEDQVMIILIMCEFVKTNWVKVVIRGKNIGLKLTEVINFYKLPFVCSFTLSSIYHSVGLLDLFFEFDYPYLSLDY